VEGVPDGRRETVAGTSHFVPMEQPEAVVQHVLEFDA